MTWLTTKELYRMFLDSDWWRNLSIRKRHSVGLCEECGTADGLQSHHIRYPDNWFDTKEWDLKVLCFKCHGLKHGINSDPNRTTGAREAYRNGFATRKQFKKHKKRSGKRKLSKKERKAFMRYAPMFCRP